MNKLSNAQVMEVLADASATLLSQRDQIAELQDKLASRERRDRVEKLASEMHRKGYDLDVTVDVLADRIEKSAEAGKSLDVIEAAVDMAGPDMGSKLASIADGTSQGTGSATGTTDFERFLVGGVG